MTAIRKFLFDLDFEHHPTPSKAKDEAREGEDGEGGDTEQEPEEIAPTFSEEDLAAARREGFEAGKQEGVHEAASAIEQEIAGSLNTVVERLGEVFAMQRQDMDRTQAAALQLVHALTAKAFPKLAEESGLGEIEAMAAGLLDRLRGEPRVVVTVGEVIAGPLKDRLAAVAAAQGFDGEIEVIGDPVLASGDCRIEWSTGGAERDLTELMAEIDAIVAGNRDALPAGDPPVAPEAAGTVETVGEEPLPGEEAPDDTPVAEEANGEQAEPVEPVEPVEPAPEVPEEPSDGGPEEPGDGDDGPPRTE